MGIEIDFYKYKNERKASILNLIQNNNIKYDHSQKIVLAIAKWRNERSISLSKIKLDQKYECDYAYLVVIL